MEAYYKVGSLVLAAALLVAVHQVWAQDCKADIDGLMKECLQYIKKSGPQVPPSQGCCDVVKKANITCVCQNITKEMEQTISMAKVVYVAKYCGRDLPHGLKCGDTTIPKK
ncbi:PREDICTED: male-cone protein 1-like [Nelumbo nucifera]|uniref:Bifunctional inhibitor/plant lipid transfer protein/seed storage helical domain-containing protein n=2 Tax=Nelumbo nucifera TaxID=4432 RepID=A0A822ZCB3_NELNU|nr:PREDICTED: male-cone protein 1-like [Nelumbo nucifera]DAD42547.1 TPA_asm: hypothetical protein HUJ06_000777 [Nelumbo nucifera]DAD44137.1 TPA_asm: hypothetical protein HUJ06_002367 [Nelumbo nucifera]